MKKILILIFSVTLLLAATTSCDDYLDITPKTILVPEQVWSSSDLVVSLLANLYNRIPIYSTIYSNNDAMSDNDELMWTGLYEDRNYFSTYAWNWQNYWDWNYIRELNSFIENATVATKLAPADQKLFIAEGRFLRAYAYFEFVKRMGGVPLITKTYVYDDFVTDPDAVSMPRSSEAEIYDFVASEIDAIKEDLLPNGTSQTRATKWTALALKTRAMIYAASLATYNSAMASPITLSGGAVGIPQSMAQGYYLKALTAAEEIITNNKFSLYQANANKADNFYEAVMKKGNSEVIFAKDFITGFVHNFTTYNIARSLREDAAESSRMSPTLGEVEAFEYTTGFDGTLQNVDAGGNYLFYTNMIDIFANKDPRLFGSILVPGSTFKGKDVDTQAGVAIWVSGNTFTFSSSSTIGTDYTDGKRWVGANGPLGEEIHTANTGFSMRKFISDKAGDAIRSSGNTVWWPYFRYSEILLIAAEAAYESSPTQTTKALGYINQVRTRAGMPSLDASTLNIARIQNERRVELAFEDSRWWDLKRFRIAHILLNGTSKTAEHWALWPYRVYAPSNPAIHNKYIFVKKKAPRQRTYSRFFQLGNYYGQFTDTYVSKNPKLIKNPNQQ